MTQLDITRILGQVLGIGERAEAFTRDTALLGNIPEFDSMAVVSVLTAIEEHFSILIDDDEVEASIFETVGTLTAFVERKAHA